MSRIITFPREWYTFTRCKFYPQSLNISSQSPWTGRRSVSAGPQIFRASLSMEDLKPEVWMAVEGLFAEVAGMSGYLRMADPARRVPQYNRSLQETAQSWSDGATFSDGTGWIEGMLPPFVTVDQPASRGDKEVVLRGLPTNLEAALRRGDDIEFRVNNIPDETPRLHRLVRTSRSNSEGKTRVEFRPALRAGLNAGDAVWLQDPMGLFRLASDDQGTVDRAPPLLGALTFDLVEAIV